MTCVLIFDDGSGGLSSTFLSSTFLSSDFLVFLRPFLRVLSFGMRRLGGLLGVFALGRHVASAGDTGVTVGSFTERHREVALGAVKSTTTLLILVAIGAHDERAAIGRLPHRRDRR